MHPQTICKNCGTHFEGNFCNWCGQKASTKKVDIKYFLHDIPHSIFHLDKGFLYTLKWMFVNPGLAIKEYLQGKRVKHFRPFAFVIILSTVTTILVPLVEKLMKVAYENKHIGRTIVVHQFFWEKYISLLIFMLIPILSLVTWISFRKKQFNYWEHFLANTFIAAMVNFLFLAVKLFGLGKIFLGMSVGVNFAAFMFFFMLYYSYSFKVLMAPHKGFWKLFFTFLIMNFFLSLIYLTAFSVTGIMTPWWGK